MDAAPRHESPHRRILLLSGQAFALGLTLAWITIPASAIFLEAYGSELLPVTYIGAAVAGAVSSSLLAAAFRRRSLSSVAIRVLAGFSFVLLTAWAALVIADAEWISFALLVFIPIGAPVGFIFVVGQAGMLLDVRSLKVLYARVVAGFALGFVAGGLAGPPLLTLLGDTENLLVAAAAATGLFLALTAETRRQYPAELSVVERPDPEAERPTLRALVRNRYVMLIVAFQMLSAVESQWLDFLVLASAAERYSDTNELARFISQFSAIAYGSDILFLLVLAGLLLRRFGLRYGLTANSIGVLTLLAAIIGATLVSGSGATIVFVLIVAARVTDLTLADGASRTSLSAAYQAVPTRLVAVAQATVEGLAVPVAIGASGVVLLILQSAGAIDGLALPVITGGVVLAWLVVAVLLYRSYRENLLANLRVRLLDPADLAVDDETSMVVIDRLIESADERDVRLGLDILSLSDHPELPARLRDLVHDERVGVRTDALERLARLMPPAATAAARQALDDSAAPMRAASIRVLGATGDPEDAVGIAAHATDPALEVRTAVAFALTRVGDTSARAMVAAEVTRLAGSGAVEDRTTAALLIGEIDPDSGIDRVVLGTLLADGDPRVVNASLAALRWPDDEALMVAAVDHLDHRHTSGAAIDALVRAGDAALELVDEGLVDDTHTRHAHEALVRIGREIGSPAAVAVLHRHVEHRDRDVGLAVMRALAVLGATDQEALDDAERSGIEQDLTQTAVASDLEHATHLLRALVALEGEPAASMLSNAIRDELELVRRRVLAAFSMRHDTQGFGRIVFQLGQRDARSHALAVEWLDVTLKGVDRAVVALFEPRWSDRERLSALTRTFPLPPLAPPEILVDVVQDPHDRWRRPWLAACALYATEGVAPGGFDTIAAAAADRWAGTDADGERSIVHETLVDLRERHLDPA